MRSEEYNLPQGFGNQFPQQFGTRPKYLEFTCGTCGNTTHGRVIADLTRKSDSADVFWCVCPCEAPTIIVDESDGTRAQYPMAREFTIGDNWPEPLGKLYEEAAKSYAAGAHTAAAMVCRKLLMATACEKGAKDGDGFAAYVDYITNQVLSFPPAQAAIRKIRDIGTDANHALSFVNPADSRKAMEIVTYMLNTIYQLPAA